MHYLGNYLGRLGENRYFRALTVILLVAVVGFAVVHFNSNSYDYAGLRGVYVSGVDGVMLTTGDGATASFEPWDPLEQNRTLSQMVDGLCVSAGLSAGCQNDADAHFSIFTKDHVITRTDGSSVTLTRDMVPLSVQDITPTLLDTRLALLGEWAKANQKSDGSLPYEYFPSNGTYPNDDYTLRQILTSQGLFAVASVTNDNELSQVALKDENYLMHTTYRTGPGGIAYIRQSDGRASLGSAAVAILSLRAEGGLTSPLSQQEKKLGEFLLSMQRDDGSFQTFYQATSTDEDERFYSGEALTALERLAEVEDDPRYDAALDKGMAYYQSYLNKDFWPQYAPWHMQAYSLAYERTHKEEYATYAFWLADGLIETMLKHDTGALPDEAGRFYNPGYADTWGPPHSASTGIYVEGLTYAYELAKEKGDQKRMARYRDAILQGTRSLLQVQWTTDDAYYLHYPERVVGAFKQTVTNNRFRIDQLGHAANALARVRSVLFDSSQQK
jgi:hypothetical protein